MSKLHKAPGENSIYTDMLKLLDHESLERITYLLHKVERSLLGGFQGAELKSDFEFYQRYSERF